MKANLHVIAATLLALAGNAQAQEDAAQPIVCTIQSISDSLNSTISPAYIEVGDTTELDLAATAISEINFKNSGPLGLSGIGAVLTRVSSKLPSVVQFEGAQETPRNQYRGILRIHSDKTITATLQVLRRRKLGTITPAGLMELGEANLTCVAKL